MARLVSRSTRTHARAPPSVPNGLIPLVDACVHARARAGMSRRTSAQLRSTCALDQTPAASACGVRGLQGHDAPTLLKYRECAIAGGGRDGDCVNYPKVTAVPADQQHTTVIRLDLPLLRAQVAAWELARALYAAVDPSISMAERCECASCAIGAYPRPAQHSVLSLMLRAQHAVTGCARPSGPDCTRGGPSTHTGTHTGLTLHRTR
jgi:hypothetical protein